MTTPTAATLLKMLDKRRVAAQAEVLGNLDDMHGDAVRRALESVPSTSRVDVDLLLSTVQRDVAARAAAEAERRRQEPCNAWKYAVTLMRPEQREAFRQFVKSGIDPNEAATLAMREASGGVRDIEPDQPPRRRKVRRIRTIKSSPSSDEPRRRSNLLCKADADPAPPHPAVKRPCRAPRRYFGPRFFLDGTDLTPEPADFPNPPWLLPPEEPDESAA